MINNVVFGNKCNSYLSNNVVFSVLLFIAFIFGYFVMEIVNRKVFNKYSGTQINTSIDDSNSTDSNTPMKDSYIPSKQDAEFFLS